MFDKIIYQTLFNFQGSVYPKYIQVYIEQDATLHSLFISGKLLYMFRVESPPITRSTHNCIYSIGIRQTVTATCRYCGRVGTGLSVVLEIHWSVLVRLQPHQNRSMQHMDTLHKVNKGRMLDVLETFYNYKETQDGNQINGKLAIKSNPFF